MNTEPEMKCIYVAGPYSKGDTIINIRAAIDAACIIRGWGHAPFVPHLTSFEHLVYQQDYEHWLETDFAWVRKSDALLRLPGESSGADREVEVARAAKVPVFFSLKELAGYLEIDE